MAANPPAGRVLVAITCWEGTNPYPTDEPLVEDGGIVTFESDFVDGFDAAGLSQGVQADVNWLRAWELPAKVFYGSSLCFMRPFTCACKIPHVPTAAQVVADLHKPDFQANAPGVQLDAVNPPWRQPPLNQTGVDQIHTDEARNYMFCHEGEEAELEDDMAPMSEQAKAAAIVSMVRSRAALRALKARVRGGTVFFVVMHPDKKTWEDGTESDPMAVHLWAVGVSLTSGNLIGAHGTQACHNLCD